MKVTVVGDGLAGLLLAKKLAEDGCLKAIYGNHQSHTPPLALLHLFAGRSFRREPLEVEAFREALSFWCALPSYCAQFKVWRQILPQSRLEHTLTQAPLGFAPKNIKANWVEYEPGFSINTALLEANLRQQLELFFRLETVDPQQVTGPKVLALGAQASPTLPHIPWDASSGRLVLAQTKAQVQRILIGQGLHLAPYPNPGEDNGLKHCVALGGRFSASGQNHQDEMELAASLIGLAYGHNTAKPEEIRLKSIWSGNRLGTADHRPVIGPIDEETFAFLGFGTRALFWLPYCIKQTIAALKGDADSITPSLSWQRFTS